MNIIPVVFSFLFGFLPGSIPFGYLAGVVNKTDIRQKGSGNIGFTNVLRILGWRWAVPVFFLDITKGLLPVAFASRLGLIPTLVGLGAIAGHIFPPWLRFQGGKGVATLIGVAFFLCPRGSFFALTVFLIVLFIFGFISLSSLSFALTLPVFTRLLYQENLPLFLFTLTSSILIIIRHTPNIKRLTKGTEPKFGLWRKIFERAKV